MIGKNKIYDLVVVGGGPAGFMAAITAADRGAGSICILESTSKPLEKVRISGGGRCNITNACVDPKELVENYPRGNKPLLGPFFNFGTLDSISWFESKGIKLKTEADGRLFPISDKSSDVVNCLLKNARTRSIELFNNSYVKSISDSQNRYSVNLINNRKFLTNKVLICTGGHSSGRKLAASLGHNIVKPVPSLFSFRIKDSKIFSLSGISIPEVKVLLKTTTKKHLQNGDILITHKGFSGPAILKLSSFAARDLSYDNYKSLLIVNWLGLSFDSVKKIISETRRDFSYKQVASHRPFKKIPRKLWLYFLDQLCIDKNCKWFKITNKLEQCLCEALVKSSFDIEGRGPFGEEFVTSGGVSADEIDFRTMESKLSPGIFFAGEVINIDGVTGGFNFQHCWTSGWIAGKAIAKD